MAGGLRRRGASPSVASICPVSRQITPHHTPELAATLENRNSRADLEDIEFTAALFGLFYARLHDGDQAVQHIAHLIGELSFDNMLTPNPA